jgi:hypothetical protein
VVDDWSWLDDLMNDWGWSDDLLNYYWSGEWFPTNDSVETASF